MRALKESPPVAPAAMWLGVQQGMHWEWRLSRAMAESRDEEYLENFFAKVDLHSVARDSRGIVGHA